MSTERRCVLVACEAMQSLLISNVRVCVCRSADGEHRGACAVQAHGVQPAHHVPAAGTGLRREGPALHRQRGPQVRGGKVQRLAAHHAESSGTVSTATSLRNHPG